MEVYQKLKQLRKERGLTLNNLAEKIGSDYQQLSRIERGKSRLTIDVLMKMADALDAPIHTLVGSKPEPKATKSPVEMQSKEMKLQETQDFLADILQGLDAFQISPRIKATLASQIYSQAMQIYQATTDVALTKHSIAHSLSLMGTLFANN